MSRIRIVGLLLMLLSVSSASVSSASGGLAAVQEEFQEEFLAGFRAGLAAGLAQGEQLCFVLAVPQALDSQRPVSVKKW